MTVTLTEVASGLTKKEGRTFNVRLISEGQGSSGYYPAETLKRDLALALPKGTHVYANHATREQQESGMARGIEEFAGSFQGEPVFDETENASYVPVKFRKDVAEFVEEFMDDIGVSIEVYEATKSDEGVIESMGYSPRNSLALVTKPGARGKVVSMMESLRIAEAQGADPDNEKNRNKMEEKDIKAIAEATAKAVAEANTPILEALKALAPAESEETETDVTVVAESLVEAGLTKAGRAAVYAAVKSGKDVDEAITEAKTQEDALRAEITEGLKAEAKKGGFRLQESEGTDFNKMFEDATKGGK